MSDKASFLKYINEVGGSDDESESSHEELDNHHMTTTAQSTESGISYDSLSTAGHEDTIETKKEDDFASHEMIHHEQNLQIQDLTSDKDSNLKESAKENDLKSSSDDNQQQDEDQVMTTIASSVTETSTTNTTSTNNQQQMLQSPPRTRIKSILHTPPATPSPSKSSLLKNNSTPSSIKRVRMSPLIKTTPTKRAMATPPRMSKPSSSTQNQSPESSLKKRPKIISPFSPRARKLRLKQSNNTPVTTSSLQWSMKPSRKVSILVNVMPHLQSHLYNDEETTLCLYPNIAPDEVVVEGEKMTFSPARSVKSSYSVTSTSSILNKATPAQEVLLVNPDIFGDIPTSITLETARMVQYFSNKSSEDWVRKFKFDEVCWPDVRQLIGIKKQNTNSTMQDIASATVHDLLLCRDSVLFGYGIYKSGRVESMFGTVAGMSIDPLQTLEGRYSTGLELGLFGFIVENLLQKCLNTTMEFQVTMVEVLEEDVVKDLLLDPQARRDAGRLIDKSIRIRHPDGNGAVIENATQVKITSLEDAKQLVKRAFKSRYNLKERQLVGGRGHIVATIHLFPDGEKVPKKNGKKDFNYPLLQLVDLACAETEQMEQDNVSGRSKVEYSRIQNKRVACIRKSMAGLGAILRHLIIAERQHLPKTTMYRSSTITKLIQRSLSKPESRAVMISTVCPKKESYKRTLHTLTFMHRLLSKPSKTAESPFESKDFDGHSFSGSHMFSPGDHSVAHSVASTVASEAVRNEFAGVKGNRAFFKSLVTDPRQRLATFYSPKERAKAGYGTHGDVPMTEITTIQEIETEPHQTEVTTTPGGYASIGSSLGDSPNNANISNGHLSTLSDEITFEGHGESTSDDAFGLPEVHESEEEEEEEEKFENDIGNQDEIIIDNEEQSSTENSVQSLSQEDSEEGNGEEDSYPRGESRDVVVESDLIDEVETGSIPVPDKNNNHREDPIGISADDLPREYFQAPQQLRYRNDIDDGNLDEEDWSDEDDLSQSYVSTLTPYDTFTGGESEDNPDHNHHMSSSEESFPRGETDSDASFPRNPTNHSDDLFPQTTGDSEPPLVKESQAVDRHEYLQQFRQEAEQKVSPNNNASPSGDNYQSELSQMMSYLDEDDEENETFDLRDNDDEVEPPVRNQDTTNPTGMELHQTPLHQTPPRKSRERKDISRDLPGFGESEDEDDVSLLLSPEEKRPKSTLALEERQLNASGDDDLSFDSSHSGEVALQPEGYSENINSSRNADMDRDSFLDRDYSDNSTPISESFVEEVVNTSTDVANAAKIQSSSPIPRVQTSMIEKVKTLVSHSEALRSYSPRGQHTPRKSLENYKALLEESLEHLEQNAHMTSVGALSIDSDDSSLQSIDNSEKEMNTTYQSNHSNQASFAGPTSDDELISNFVSSKPISSRNQITQEGESTIDPEAILTDIEQLKESIKKLVDSTNEADLITELSKDTMDVTESFGNKGQPINHTIKELTSQTEALQTFITSTIDQLNTSRLSEREKQNEVLEANSKLEETLDEIQSLRTSNTKTMNQIKKDHLDALDAVRKKQDLQSDRLKQQSTLRTQLQQKEAQVNDLESTISSLQRKIDELSEQINDTITEREREVAHYKDEIKSKDNAQNSEMNELKRLVNELSEKLSNEISKRNEVENRLGSEKAISTNVASRLENELQAHRDLQKKIAILEEKLTEKDSVNAVVSDENNIIKQEYREKITKLEEEYLQRTEKEKAELENKVTLLQQHISKSESDKDALEDRLTLELNSEREKMANIIRELQKKVDQQQGDLLHSQDTLRQEYIEKVKILEERLDVKEQEKDDLEDQMVEEIQSLKNLLESKQRAEGNIEDELHVLKTNFERKLEYAEKEKESLKREIDILKERVADERSESSKQSRSLNSKVGEMERSLTRKDDQIQQLEDRLKSTKRSFEETKRSLSRTSELFEEETLARSDLTKKIQDLQHELNQAVIAKGHTESELMNEVKKLRKELQSNEKKSHSLQTEIEKLHSEYNELVKKSSREKSSQEDEIQILQDRLKSESENGDIKKAELLDQIAELRRELAEEKHENDDINSTLLELREDFENSQERFKTVEQSRLLLEDKNNSLNERLDEESRRFKRQKIEFETKIQEYETKSNNATSQIDRLNETLVSTREDLESTKSTLADEKSNNNSLQNMITALQGQLSTVTEERDNAISSSDDKIKSLTEELSENERLGTDLKSQLESLKSMLSTTEEDAAIEKAKMNEINAALQEANKSLEERLSSECKDFKRELEKSKSENKTLKEHLEAEVKKLTEDLTLRMQEKAEYEVTTRNLESILEERSAERDQLEEALEKQQQDYVQLQETFTSLQQDHLSQKEESSKQTQALRDELEQQESAVLTLTENLQTTERELQTSNTSLAHERDNIKSLQDEIAFLKQQLAELTTKYDALKSTTSAKIGSLQDEVDTKARLNDDLGSQLESLKSMLSTTEEDAATEKAKMNEINAALQEANKSLEEKLQDSDVKLSDTLRALGESKSENKTLKEHLEAEVKKLTEDLTLRMQEKAEYEVTTKNLESILEERSAERDQLEEALEMQVYECEKLRNEISQREGKIKDVEEQYKGRINAFEKQVEELKSRESALESEFEDQKEHFQEQIEELIQGRDSEFEKNKLYIQSIDQLRKELSEENEELNETIQDLEATILSYEKKEAEYIKDKSHITQQNIDLQNNVTDLSSKLAKEIANIASINSLHEDEIERILEKHDQDKEELRRQLDDAKDTLKELENTTHDEVVRLKAIIADLESKISILESELSKKNQVEDELREKLRKNSSEMVSLNEQLAVMSEDQTEVIREHTERISTLTRTIREKEIEIITQQEYTSDLEETIEQMKIKLEEIINSRNNIEQSSLAKISALEKDIDTKQLEMDELKSKLSEQKNSIASASTQLESEIDKKNELQMKLYATETELSKVRDKKSSIETKMQILEEKLATSTVKIATFQSEKDRLLDDIDRFKQMKEAEKTSFEERSKSHEMEVQDLSEIINGMKEEIQNKESSIEDLQTNISDLKRQMQDQESKSRILSDNINIKDEESNRYLTEINSLKKKLQREKDRGTSRLDHLQKSLDEEKDANRHRIETLERTFLEKDKLIKSLEKTIREKDLVNSNLSQSLEHTRDTLNSKIHELQEDSKTNDDVADQKFQELSQRVSDLCVVTETLKHEKTTLSEKLKEEKEYRERLQRKNKLLKDALTDNDKKVREEMKELEFTMNSTISRLESKRQKVLEIEKEQMSNLLNELEDENETYKIRVTQLESTIRRLERQSKVRSNMSSSGSVNSHSNPADFADLQKENERLKRRIARMEQRQPLGDNMSVGSGRSFREREGRYGRDEPHYYSELQSERARRIKAEEFAAAMAARAKAGMEKRNEEIIGLRMQVSTLENTKENYDNQRQLLLGTVPSASRNNDQLRLLSQERDEAKQEANQYKAIAEKLNSQVIAMHGAIENDVIENEDEESF